MNRLHRLLAACLLTLLLPAAVMAQETEELSEIQALLQEHREIIEDSSRRTIGPAIDAIAASGIPAAQDVLERWQARELWQRTDDGLFFFTEDAGEDADGEDLLTLIDIATGDEVGTALEDDMDQLRPNSGIQRMMAAALVRFQLTDPSVIVRTEALDAIARSPEESHLAVLRDAIEQEENAAIRQRMDRLSRLLTIQFAESDAERIEAIESFGGDLSLDVRATLNPLVQTRLEVAEGAAPEGEQVARVLRPGSEALSKADAYALLVEDELAPPLISGDDQKAALVANIADGQVAGIQVADLNTDDARDLAYAELVRQGAVEAAATEDEIDEIIEGYAFYEVYTATSPEVVAAALGALRAIDRTVAIHQFLDLTLDALSLASIYFLAAIGLAITFGVMRVINMAHGEFIMMGAYTGYVVQQFIPNYTASIAVAIPLAFLVTFSAGVAMERLVIRWLYHRPLETLLATFGISIALQQLAKNIFGTQARPLTSPDWLGGALVFNDVVSISYIRVAIFVLALIFLGVFLFIMNKTRVGLEVRAVTQNPRMAASMGINPDKINMLTFGLGSGIAGIAGVAIGLYAQVTSEIGQAYIVQSFMTVVVGGVGNIWGTLLGATLIGFLQKFIEWFNPSNTLAAQTYMIIFIIIFIQFRPRGLIALKGRAAEA
ncbi:urea ABC transporter permease subunit UrtB [Psychromarinibacter halotolerans]|uniref:Urea ABC transporter permease subunit UrtB n=1 Tax=Psychromarinibacter halotolerans TaxID=1775175 RepID=A0ABV7GP97_9RHOB|nr:urea ABC transporter permease subunit UrtB [Psychromarinibacter halotolerans]MDF0594497.1 urea ABC transporter permease subunit UrtB [Psychromarinibacter halotolerans]